MRHKQLNLLIIITCYDSVIKDNSNKDNLIPIWYEKKRLQVPVPLSFWHNFSCH